MKRLCANLAVVRQCRFASSSPQQRLEHFSDTEGRPRFGMRSMRELVVPRSAVSKSIAGDLWSSEEIERMGNTRLCRQVQAVALTGNVTAADQAAAQASFAGVVLSAGTAEQTATLAKELRQSDQCGLLAEESEILWETAPGTTGTTMRDGALYTAGPEQAKKLKGLRPRRAAVLCRLDGELRWAVVNTQHSGVSVSEQSVQFNGAACQVLGRAAANVDATLTTHHLAEASKLSGLVKHRLARVLDEVCSGGLTVGGVGAGSLATVHESLVPLMASVVALSSAIEAAARLADDNHNSAPQNALQVHLYANALHKRMFTAYPSSAMPCRSELVLDGMAAAVARRRVDESAHKVPYQQALSIVSLIARGKWVGYALRAVAGHLGRPWAGPPVGNHVWLLQQASWTEQLQTASLLGACLKAASDDGDTLDVWTRERGRAAANLGYQCADHFALRAMVERADDKHSTDSSIAPILKSLSVAEGLRNLRNNWDSSLFTKLSTKWTVLCAAQELRVVIAELSQDVPHFAEVLGSDPSGR